VSESSYDATRNLGARPPNWGLLPDADVRVDVIHVGRTAAVLTLALDGDTVRAARFKSRGVGDRYMLLARAVRAFEGRTLTEMSLWQLKEIAAAVGVDAPRPGPDQTVLGLALLAIRNAIDTATSGRGASAGTAAVHDDDAEVTVCYCVDVSEATILAAIRDRGATTVAQITAKTGAVGGCGTCRPEVQAILDREGVTPTPEDPTAPYRQSGGPPWVIGEPS
jgi:bacterioferritin-associated ferredoxin